MAKYFWGKFKLDPADYDIVGLSFYPAWDDSIDLLKQNMADAIQITGKDVILAETSYPWKELPDKVGLATLQWPQTPEGQKQYLHDLTAVIACRAGGSWERVYLLVSRGDSVAGLRSGGRVLKRCLIQSGNALPALESFGQRWVISMARLPTDVRRTFVAARNCSGRRQSLPVKKQIDEPHDAEAISV